MNDVPVVNDLDGDVVTFTEGNAFVLVDATPLAASIADIDSADLDGGSLTVAFSPAALISGNDELFIRAATASRSPARPSATTAT